MGAWAQRAGATGKVVMLADGSGAFTRAMGLELDLIARGLGVRSQRFALVAQDGTGDAPRDRAAGRLRCQPGGGGAAGSLSALLPLPLREGAGGRGDASGQCAVRDVPAMMPAATMLAPTLARIGSV